MPKKSTNQLIEELAQSVNTGFEDVRKEFLEVHKELGDIHKELDGIDGRLLKIENGHVRRFELLEDNMRLVKTKIGIL